MHPVSKETAMQLRMIASKMPMVIMNTHEKHIYTKEELDEWGFVDAEKLPDGKYLYRYPVQLVLNHYRALKKAWKKDGFNGAMNYIDRVNKLPNVS